MMGDAEKDEFLKQFGDYYGYSTRPKTIDEIRATEFKRLDEGVVYLDHAGASLYSELQMEAIFKELTTSVYGNPHSQSDSSSATSNVIAEARQQVLEYFNASPKDYSCIFTSGTTAALKLIGETFPWTPQSSFMYTMENHNSVLGIREYALNQGASVSAVDIEGAVSGCEQSISSRSRIKIIHHPVQRRSNSGVCIRNPAGDTYKLFAFPSECNFTGLRFNLDLVNIIKENPGTITGGSSLCKGGRWMVLIDAAKGSATEPPDLSKFSADFVVMSFYKLFGYPTGLGALIIRNDSAKLLKKTYFSGGTVAASIADIDFFKRREGIEESFEDGSASFLSIASIRHGFKILKSLSVVEISRHTTSLAMYVKKTLLDLRHGNGVDVCVIYGSTNLELPSHEMGPTVTFNLKRHDGSWFGYREVEKLASLSGIQLRTGCFCNPGACAKYLGLSHSELLSNIEAGHVCWDDNDVINGKPTGAVRVSFGYMSTYEESKKFIDFVVNSFVSLPNKYEKGFVPEDRSISRSELKKENGVPRCFLKSITIYPIKSCAGFAVNSWPLSSTGLLHDREWQLLSLTGETLTQKKVPEMSCISTFINLNDGILFVESPRCKEKLRINIKRDTDNVDGLHSNRFEAEEYENRINHWFTIAVGRPCMLLRYSSSSVMYCRSRNAISGLCRNVETKLNFANEAQFLLVSDESVSDLNKRLHAKEGRKDGEMIKVEPSRFRPNLVIYGGWPYAEDGWRNLKIGNSNFISLGGCNRCQMINISHEAGQVQKSNEPLSTLASYRRTKGRILFGILLKCDVDDESEVGIRPLLQVGQEVLPNTD